MTILDIRVYPVKGMKGVHLTESAVERRGLLHDRRWMVVDADNRFLSQREMPIFALFRAELAGDGLALTGPDGSRCHVGTNECARTETCTVWKSDVNLSMAPEAVNQWLTALLGVTARLGWMPDQEHRAPPADWSEPGEAVSLADAFPILLTTEASLNAVNQRLGQPIGFDRFRPNVIVKGGLPFEEDGWSSVRLGGVETRMAKPCGRCSVTTIDQETGLSTGKEPLATLAQLNAKENGVFFGAYLAPRAPGFIRIGDSVTCSTAL